MKRKRIFSSSISPLHSPVHLDCWTDPQARAGFLLKIADRIDERLEELALAESRDQVPLTPHFLLFFLSHVLVILPFPLSLSHS